MSDSVVTLALPGRGTGGRLRLGVIGAGAWAVAAHIPGFLRRPEVEPWIVSRRDPAILEVVRDRFGFAQATTDRPSPRLTRGSTSSRRSRSPSIPPTLG